MFKRLLYKIHLSEIFNLKRIALPREVFNLGLALLFIVFGSFYFAFQGITQAQGVSVDQTSSGWSPEKIIGTTKAPEQTTDIDWFNGPQIGIVPGKPALISGYWQNKGLGIVTTDNVQELKTLNQNPVSTVNGSLFTIATSKNGDSIMVHRSADDSKKPGNNKSIYFTEIYTLKKKDEKSYEVNFIKSIPLEIPTVVYSASDNKFYIGGVDRRRDIGSGPYVVYSMKADDLSISDVIDEIPNTKEADAPVYMCSTTSGGLVLGYTQFRNSQNNVVIAQKKSGTWKVDEITAPLNPGGKKEFFLRDLACSQDGEQVYAMIHYDKGIGVQTYSSGKWSDTVVSVEGEDNADNTLEASGDVASDGNFYIAVGGGHLYTYISTDQGKTFTNKEQPITWPAWFAPQLRIDNETGTIHLVANSNGGPVANKERRTLYTSKKISIGLKTVKIASLSCIRVDKIRNPVSDEDLKQSTLFSTININKQAGNTVNIKLTGKTDTNTNAPVIQANFSGGIDIKDFTAPQNVEHNVYVQLYPTVQCPLADAISFVKSYATQNNTTFDDLLKDDKKLDQALFDFHVQRYANHKTEYMNPPVTDNSKKVITPESTIRNNLLSTLPANGPADSINTAVLKDLANTRTNAATLNDLSLFNKLGYAGKTTVNGDLILKNASLSITGINQTIPVTTGDIAISATQRNIIGQQNQDALNASDLSTERGYNFATTQAEIHTHSAPNIQGQVTNQTAFAMIPFRLASSDNIVLPINDIEGFATSGAAQDYFNSLPIATRKQFPGGYNDFMRGGSVLNWVKQQFGEGTADACARQKFESGSRCSQLDSVTKDLSKNADDLFFDVSKLGIPKSGINFFKDQATKLSIASLEADPNVFSKANTYKFNFEYKASIDISGCDPGLCKSNISPTIKGTMECDACKANLTEGIKDLEGATGARLSLEEGSGLKLPVAKDYFNYAMKTAAYNGQAITLNRNSDAFGFADYMSIYNNFPDLNIGSRTDPIPFITEIGKKFDSNGSQYKPYINPNIKYGSLVDTNSEFSDFSYGAIPIRDLTDKSDKHLKDSLIAFRFKGKNVREVTDQNFQGVDLLKVIDDKANKIPNYESLKKGETNGFFNAERAPQIALTNTSTSCGLSQDLHVLIPSTPVLNIPFFFDLKEPPSVYLSYKNKVAGSSSATSLGEAAAAAIIGGVSCSLGLDSSFENFDSWTNPLFMPYYTKLVSSSDTQLTTNTTAPDSSKMAFISPDPDGLKIYVADSKALNGQDAFYNFKNNTPVSYSEPKALINGQRDSEYKVINLKADLGITSTDPSALTYEGNLTPNGKLIIVVNSSDGKIGVYTWDLNNLSGTAPALVGKYNIKNFIDPTAPGLLSTSTKVTAVDAYPTNQNVFAFSIDLTKKFIGLNGLIPTFFDKHYPMIIYSNGTNLTAFDYSPDKQVKLYEDNTKYYDDHSIQVASMDVKDLKFLSNGHINVATQITPNAGMITDPFRSAIVMVVKCEASQGKYPYTVAFKISNGDYDCDNGINETLQVAKDDTFGYYLKLEDMTFDKGDGLKSGRQIGKETIGSLFGDFKNGQTVTAGNTTGDGTGSGQRPSDDYAEAAWSVPDETMLVGPLFADDKNNTTLQNTLVEILKQRGHSDALARSEIKILCDAANANGRQVSCALLFATWGQEDSFNQDPENDNLNLGCLDGTRGLVKQADCSARTYTNLYNEYKNGPKVIPCSQFGKTYGSLPYKCPSDSKVKFATAYSYVEQRYTPTDLRFFDPNNRNDFDNQCTNRTIPGIPNAWIGIMRRPDHDTGCYDTDAQCNGISPYTPCVRNMQNPPHGPAQDTRMNLRFALYGDWSGSNLKPITIPQIDAAGGTVTSKLDSRIKITTHFYPSTGNSTGTQLARGAKRAGQCDVYRTPAYVKDTVIAGVSAVDFTALIDKCLPAATVNVPQTPEYITMHFSEAPSDQDYVNMSEAHAFDIKDWTDPTYHYYIRSNGLIEYGQPGNQRSVHTYWKCGTEDCNTNAIGVSLEGGYVDVPSSAASASALRLVKQLMSDYRITDVNKVIGHCEINLAGSPHAGEADYLRSDPMYSGNGLEPSNPRPTSSSSFDTKKAYCLEASKLFRQALASGNIPAAPGGTTTNPTTSRTQVVDIGNFKPEISIGDTSKKQVIFTFDAGGQDVSTQKVVDTLRNNNLTGTFFVTGQFAELHPDRVKSISDAGNEIFSHTYSHCSLTTASCPTDIDPNNKKLPIEEEFSKTENIISKITGKTTKPFFRAPYGDRTSSGSNPTAMLETAYSLGYRHVFWTKDVLDWKEVSGGGWDKDPIGSHDTEVINNYLNNLNNGTIFLIHVNDSITGRILDNVIKQIKDRGYNIVPLSKGL